MIFGNFCLVVFFCFYYESKKAILRGKLIANCTRARTTANSLSFLNKTFIFDLHFKFLSTLYLWNREVAFLERTSQIRNQGPRAAAAAAEEVAARASGVR